MIGTFLAVMNFNRLVFELQPIISQTQPVHLEPTAGSPDHCSKAKETPHRSGDPFGAYKKFWDPQGPSPKFNINFLHEVEVPNVQCPTLCAHGWPFRLHWVFNVDQMGTHGHPM